MHVPTPPCWHRQHGGHTRDSGVSNSARMDNTASLVEVLMDTEIDVVVLLVQQGQREA
ncbi:MAG: hypothetical protein Fur005_34790 [Roseiflexaceae bacterium]